VSQKGSKHIWVDSVFDGDSKSAKNTIGYNTNFWKSSLFFQRSVPKLTLSLHLRKLFANEKMPLHLGCRTTKTASLYLVLSKSYLKNSHTHGLFGQTLVSSIIVENINQSKFVTLYLVTTSTTTSCEFMSIISENI
jgi:hypothetical protein